MKDYDLKDYKTCSNSDLSMLLYIARAMREGWYIRAIKDEMNRRERE